MVAFPCTFTIKISFESNPLIVYKQIIHPLREIKGRRFAVGTSSFPSLQAKNSFVGIKRDVLDVQLGIDGSEEMPDTSGPKRYFLFTSSARSAVLTPHSNKRDSKPSANTRQQSQSLISVTTAPISCLKPPLLSLLKRNNR